MRKGQKIYLSGPPHINSLAITRIVNGQTRNGIDIDLQTIASAYKELSWEDFSEAYVRPAFAQLFNEENLNA